MAQHVSHGSSRLKSETLLQPAYEHREDDELVESYEYDPLGRPRFLGGVPAAGAEMTGTDPSIGNRMLFTGREYEAAAGASWLAVVERSTRARYFSLEGSKRKGNTLYREADIEEYGTKFRDKHKSLSGLKIDLNGCKKDRR